MLSLVTFATPAQSRSWAMEHAFEITVRDAKRLVPMRDFRQKLVPWTQVHGCVCRVMISGVRKFETRSSAVFESASSQRGTGSAVWNDKFVFNHLTSGRLRETPLQCQVLCKQKYRTSVLGTITIFAKQVVKPDQLGLQAQD